MATEFSQDAVLRFLLSKNGRVKNADLLYHFRAFLREDENKTQNRELFKKFVNAVAVVKQEEGVSFVLLRKIYTRQIGVCASPPPNTFLPGNETSKPKKYVPRKEPNTKRGAGQAFTRTDINLKIQNESDGKPYTTPKGNGIGNGKLLASAGILNNGAENVYVETYPPFAAEQTPPITTDTGVGNRTCSLQSQLCNAEFNQFNGVVGKRQEQVREKSFAGQTDPAGKLEQSKEFHGQRKSFIPPPDHRYSESKVLLPEPEREKNVHVLRKEIKPKSLDLESTAYHSPNTGSPARISSSFPCVKDCHYTPGALIESLPMTTANGSLPKPDVAPGDTRSVVSGATALSSPCPVYQSVHLENPRSPMTTRYSESHRAGLSSSYGDLLLPSYQENEWPQGTLKEEWASDEGLNFKGLTFEQGFGGRDTFRLTHDATLLAMLHRAERRVTPRHHSTYDLNDPAPSAARAGAEPSVRVPLRPEARKTNRELRSRMCRSLGADLDQPLYEDGVSARHNRLYMLSSSLCLKHPLSVPSRAHSSRDVAFLDDPSGRVQSANEGSYFQRNSSIPLDSKEHSWLVKAAAGCWTEIYSLFRDEPSLLDKRDFISGYTVLHWIAKHGDHRVLNTLWYGVSKAGMKLDVNTKTSCGYTPLHLAAIHGHKKLIRLLVHKFQANVMLRDTSGKKPWQYLGRSGPQDLLQLLGAPQTKASDFSVPLTSLETLPLRPVTTMPMVKRQTSIAAFLKHKSLLKMPANSESFV